MKNLKHEHAYFAVNLRIAITLFIAISQLNVAAQNKRDNLKFYFCMIDLGPLSQKFADDNHIEQVASFDSRYIDPAKSSSLNTNTLTAAIVARFPGPTSAGIGMLDWEGPIFENLKKDPQSAEFKAAINTFIQTIKFAKTLRPNVKWGYYALPVTTYWNRNDKWIQTNQQIKALLKESDVFFPSFYVFYKDGSNSPDDNEKFVSDNLTPILSIAKELNKPVLPFVWHRYHDSNKTLGLQLIPLADFAKYVNKLLQVNVKGKKITGLVLWGDDTYYYNIKSKALVDEMGNRPRESFSAHHDSVIINYSNVILKSIKQD